MNRALMLRQLVGTLRLEIRRSLFAKRALAGDAKPGFQTPSMAYGPDFILEFDGVVRTDLD